jgi:hypothetical protein
MNYLTRAGGHRQTPQSRPMRKDQVENSAGGFVWEVDPFTRLERFLILGSEGGSYYATEQDLTQQNVDCLDECLDEDDVRAVKLIVGVSGSGRAATPLFTPLRVPLPTRTSVHVSWRSVVFRKLHATRPTSSSG